MLLVVPVVVVLLLVVCMLVPLAVLKEAGLERERTMSLCEMLCTSSSIRRFPMISIPGHMPREWETRSCTSGLGPSLRLRLMVEEREARGWCCWPGGGVGGGGVGVA